MKKVLDIHGMTCYHCKMHVTKALLDVPGVTSASVHLEQRKADVEFDGDVPDDALKQAVADAGYTVTGITKGKR
ncbi:MAG: heavy-metal-associated domain-containing protein [Nitrospinae bacterium]|nr:heavy-metal-associated domain-containing protein [Nitrospinota bacterium]